jgi:4-hydroxybenzoate polyprenyltransferase
LPCTLFALSVSLADELLVRPSTFHRLQIFCQLPRTVVWAWFQLLAFCIDNQKSPASVKEDQINKPWRPIPANLLRSQDAEWLTPIAYSTALMIGASLGGFKQSVVLALAGYCYNNLGGSEKVVERNLLNVLGILCYNTGAVTVANKGLNFTFTENYPLWIAIVAAIIFSTVQIQDFRDQEGDSIRGRKTFPLILGDQFTRYITSAAVNSSRFPGRQNTEFPSQYSSGGLHIPKTSCRQIKPK